MSKEEYPKEAFKNHILTVIHEGDRIKRYQYRQPNTGCYGFNLTCADNLMVMNGDCYSMLIEPGYGRCGLAFLRGSINSTDYFLSKGPRRNNTFSEYKREYALEDMKEWVEEECITMEQYDKLKEGLWMDDDGEYGRQKYYELCYNLEIEEPPYATRMTSTTKMQLAGLMCFVEAYETLEKSK